MSNVKISNYSKYCGKQLWDANFSGSQPWAGTLVATGGYGGWTAGSGYFPQIADNCIEWSSTGYWYYGYALSKFVTMSASQIAPSIIEGEIYGSFTAQYHKQSVSCNFFCDAEDYASDGGSGLVRNTNGLSIVLTCYGGYYGSYTQCTVYLNNVAIGVAATTLSSNGSYTVKFKIVGNLVYLVFEAGDTRGAASTYVLISTTMNLAAVAGRKTIVWYFGQSTNDQGQYLGGAIYSIKLVNYL